MNAMVSFILYELKVAVILAAFCLCFKWLLSGEKMHRLNRAVLVSTSILSFILPLCIITVRKTVPMAETAAGGIIRQEEAADIAAGSAGTVLWESLAIAAYWLGVAFVFGGILSGIIKVMKIIRSGEKKVVDGTAVTICEGTVPPFSWMKWIVMSREDYDSGNRHMLEHEKAHIRLGHSKEVLLFDVMSAFQWFNPAMWLLKKDLRAIHEYEADDAVLRNGADIKEYQYSLIRKAVSASGYSITNSFNHSILKNRITMMSKRKASTASGLKALYVMPLLCGALALNAKTVYTYKGSENIAERQDVPVKGDTIPFQVLDVKPSFNGGDAFEFTKWVNANLKYPADAKADKVQGRVTIQFDVEPDGNVGNARVLRGVAGYPSLDEEALRVVSGSPAWTPGKKDGKNVPVTYTFPVIFQLESVTE